MLESLKNDVFFWKIDDLHEKYRFWMNVGRREAANLGTCLLVIITTWIIFQGSKKAILLNWKIVKFHFSKQQKW